ncbi:MAG: protein kinase [Vicinamibacterales bacterium]
MPSGDILIGQTLGHYRVIDRIGSGGMGVVYRAEDLHLGRTVALKFLSPALAGDAQAVERLQREARAASALSHPGICTIHDVGSDAGVHFIAMELIQGDTLAARIAGRPMPVAEVIDIATQIADALDAAHGAGIIHRDLKPANVLLTPRGQVKVLDFGLAKQMPGAADETVAAATLTADGTAVGTLAYMSPEQARGEPIDARSDIFALGLIMYEMATGRPPFAGPTSALIFDAILNRDPSPPSSAAPGLPSELNVLIVRAMAKERSRRVPSASELLSELRGIKRQLESGAARAARSTRSIAVIPFTDLSQARDQQYFCEGMADEIITALSGLEGLRVASRTSAVRAHEKGLDIGEIGRALNAQVVLEGTVRKAGNRLRISAQLTSVDDGFQLWGERYDRDMDDVFAIQDEIARAIAAQLKVKLLDAAQAPLVRPGTSNLEAYNLYLKGRYHWQRRNHVHLRLALDAFAQAADADPDYALAHSGLADVYTVMAIYSVRPTSEMLPKAQAAAERALMLDPELPEAHHSIGAIRFWMQFDWSGAESAYARALELNPRLALAHAYRGVLLGALCRRAESCAATLRACELEPHSAVVAYIAASVHYWAGDVAASARLAERAVEFDPEAGIAHWALASARWAAGDLAGSAEAAARAVGTARAPLFVASLGVAHARRGRTADAEALLAELLARAAREYITPVAFAELYLSLGRVDEALEWLERGCEDRSCFMIRVAAAPEWRALRAEPRFIALLERMSLPASPL